MRLLQYGRTGPGGPDLNLVSSHTMNPIDSDRPSVGRNDREALRRALVDDLRVDFDGDLRIDGETIGDYTTASGAYAIEPLAIARPRHEGDCLRLVEALRERQIPIVARGAGTGMGGHNVGSGVIVDFTAYMNTILTRDDDDRRVRIQPGIICDALNQSLRPDGRFFAPDPSSSARCSVGGMIANNAGGLRTVRYGATKFHVEALRVVLPDGSRATLQSDAGDAGHAGNAGNAGHAGNAGDAADLPPQMREARDAIAAARDDILAEPPGPHKHASGYNVWDTVDTFDPVRLMVGSEGTLGLLTEATITTEPLAAARGVLLAAFRDIRSTGTAIPAILAHRPSALELMDRTLLDAVRAVGLHFAVPIPDDTDTVLLIEIEDDHDDAVDDRIAALRAMLDCDELRPALLRGARGREEQAELWGMRTSSSPIIARRTDGKRTLQIVEDGGVEPRQVGDYIAGIRSIFRRNDIEVVAFGHAGNGNIHVNPLFDVSRRDYPQQVRRVAEEVTDLIIGLGGTLTAEHGDGRVRAPYLARRFPRLMPLFTRIKNIFDPQCRFNPGVIVPLEGQSVEQYLRYPAGDRTGNGDATQER